MSRSATPERWARLIDERAPGLTWLAATLLEWSALLPVERRSWRVTAAASRDGEIQALAALHEDTGLLAIAARPDVPPPLLGLPEAIRRIIAEPAVVDHVIEAVPELAARLLVTVRRTVHVAADHLRVDDPAVRRARDEEVPELERLLHEGGADPDPMDPIDLTTATTRGLVWVLADESGVHGTFRVAGASMRHVQIDDLFVPEHRRGHGVGRRLARAAARVAREEYTGSAVIAAVENAAVRHTLAGAGYLETSSLDDVRLR